MRPIKRYGCNYRYFCLFSLCIFRFCMGRHAFHSRLHVRASQSMRMGLRVSQHRDPYFVVIKQCEPKLHFLARVWASLNGQPASIAGTRGGRSASLAAEKRSSATRPTDRKARGSPIESFRNEFAARLRNHPSVEASNCGYARNSRRSGGNGTLWMCKSKLPLSGGAPSIPLNRSDCQALPNSNHHSRLQIAMTAQTVSLEIECL
jgi:hypothetical protein